MYQSFTFAELLVARGLIAADAKQLPQAAAKAVSSDGTKVDGATHIVVDAKDPSKWFWATGKVAADAKAVALNAAVAAAVTK